MPLHDVDPEQITQRLAEHIAGMAETELPTTVTAQAKLVLLDSIACAVGGSALPPAGVAAEMALRNGGVPDATVVGRGGRVPASWAAFANAVATNALDMDDTQEGHPGAVVVPVALATAQRAGASGATLLKAIVTGYDLCERLGRAMKPSPQRYREVYGFGSFQALSAVATAAVVLRLDADRVLHALGLAGVSAPVPSHRKAVTLSQRPLSWVKNNYGWVAMNGVVSADLAEAGFRAPADILDGDDGLWRMIGSDAFRPADAIDGLGSRFSILDTGFKPYPCCRYIQSSIDALLEILAEAAVRPEDVTSVRVRSFHRLAEFMDPHPTGFMEAMFSLPHSLACAAAGIPPGPQWSSGQALADPRVRRLADRVAFELDEEADAAFFDERRYVTTVTVSTGSDTWTRHRRATRGDPDDPLGEPELRQKFHHLCDPILGARSADALERAIDAVDAATDLTAMAEAISTVPEAR